MKNFLIGIIIGIGKIIPGVSGSVIAIRFNVYEKIISSITNYFKDIKNNTIFLASIFSGVILSIILFSNAILYLYSRYHYTMIFLFAILILSGTKEVYSKGCNIKVVLLTILVTVILLKIPFKFDINYYLIGLIESFSMIVPGISGTAIFVSLGVYEKVLGLFIEFNIDNLFWFFLGFGMTSLVIIKIIDYLFKVHKKETYSSILGFLISSVILMFI